VVFQNYSPEENGHDRHPFHPANLALWRHDYNNVRPHSSLDNKTPAEARRALEQSGGSAPGALAQTETDHYQPRRLSL
jgi:putative transposase